VLFLTCFRTVLYENQQEGDILRVLRKLWAALWKVPPQQEAVL
jgi:hypothetical protein